MRKILMFAQLGILVFLCLSTITASAETEEARASLAISPIKLSNGSQITLMSEHRWSGVARKLGEVVQRVDRSYRQILGDYGDSNAVIKLLDAETFYRTTKAPRWTNAIYYRDQIVIPMNDAEKLDADNLIRSIRHEYTHAVIHSLSKGRCPGWFDEGLAQLLEGEENPALKPAVMRWLGANPPVPFSLLQGGFTKLPEEMVAPAYGQSLYATRFLSNRFGFRAIRTYLSKLSIGYSSPEAFEMAFQIRERDFEHKLGEFIERIPHYENQAHPLHLAHNR